MAHPEVDSNCSHFPLTGFSTTVEKDQIVDSLTTELVNSPAELERVRFKPLIKYDCYSKPLLWYDE